MTDGLLLLHAWPLDSRMWEPQRSALPSALSVAAPNHPGFGGSPPAGAVMTMQASEERALAEMDAAGIDRAVVCGISIGGYIAFEIWRRARHRVLGLVLANTRPGADPPEAAERRRELAARLRQDGNVLADQPPPLLAPDAPEALRDLVRGIIAEQSAEAIAAAALGMAERPDSTPNLVSIGVPTLVITSSEDQLIASEISAEMARSIPSSRLEILEGVGHLTNLEAPEAFNDHLLRHLGACGLV